MSQILEEVLTANAAYAVEFRQGTTRAAAGAAIRDAHLHGRAPRSGEVCRPGGGRRPRHPQRRRRASDDAIRSLVISHKLLGTLEWFVIHHTDCGMERSPTRSWARCWRTVWKRRLRRNTWSNPKHGGGDPAGLFIKWHTITDQTQSVTQDVPRIRSHPLVPAHIPIYGYIYDVRSGELVEVPDATRAGAPRD